MLLRGSQVCFARGFIVCIGHVSLSDSKVKAHRPSKLDCGRCAFWAQEIDFP
jgi:hypothetical protein